MDGRKLSDSKEQSKETKQINQSPKMRIFAEKRLRPLKPLEPAPPVPTHARVADNKKNSPAVTAPPIVNHTVLDVLCNKKLKRAETAPAEIPKLQEPGMGPTPAPPCRTPSS